VKVKYVGPNASVELRPESDLVVENGQEVDLPSEVVNELVATGEWEKPSAKKPSGEEE
jgi:hypothetical protein